MNPNQNEIRALLSDVKKLGARYKKLTGKPLGITGEVAEYNAATLLNLDLTGARIAGYDVIGSGGKKYRLKGDAYRIMLKVGSG